MVLVLLLLDVWSFLVVGDVGVVIAVVVAVVVVVAILVVVEYLLLDGSCLALVVLFVDVVGWLVRAFVSVG